MRVFEDKDIIHVAGKVAPLEDISVINLELVLADLETVSKRLAGLEKEVKARKKEALAEHAVLEKVRATLEAGRLAKDAAFSAEEGETVRQLNLLTLKPILYILNVSEASRSILDSCFRRNDKTGEIICEKIVGQFIEIDPIFGTGLDTLITKAYETLGLITFFTTGEDETRAWTIKRGSTAPEAGAAIHTDFRERFIRAEVIQWRTLLEAGSYAAARERGLVRTEGKEYIVQDGDVVEFKI